MSTATSKAEVEGMFRRLVRSATGSGADTTDWVLEEGSVTYGRAWRLYRRDPVTGGLANTMGDSYLGSNRREAYLSLYGMARAFEALVPAGAR